MFSDFMCNICGAHSVAEIVHRELALCTNCGSNARFRAMMVGLSTGLYSDIVPLHRIQADRSIRGFGCSDSPVYADRLTGLFSYVNTFLHVDPRVDICDSTTLTPYQGCRFILCSDVLEHVLANPEVALRNMHNILSPGGFLVVSAPTYVMPETLEKYPSLRSYGVLPLAGRHVVVYETMTGVVGFDPDPMFHGGPGSVLEMRLFSHAALLRTLSAVGFTKTLVVGDDAIIFGATWPQMVERNDVPFQMDGRVIVAIK